MMIAMAGVDHETAGIEIRERFALTDQARASALDALKASGGAEGYALVNTCNRTELYLSLREGAEADAAALLLGALGLSGEENRGPVRVRRGRDAALHLMQVAAGLCSQVLGEDQILAQIRSAAEAAQACGAMDAALSTLFRLAQTCGKRIRSELRFVRADASVAERAIREAEARLGGLAGRQALVIGGGAMGMLTTAALLARGCRVTVARRTHRPRDGAEGEGAQFVPFDAWPACAARTPLIVSATSSAQTVVRAAQVACLPAADRLFVDLAMPRDIELAVGALPGATLINLDDLKPDGLRDLNVSQILSARRIAEEYLERFERWHLARSAAGAPPRFPIFIDLSGRDVVVVGGGRIAARRVNALLPFGARITVVAPRLAPGLHPLAERGDISWISREYLKSDLAGAAMAVAVTSSREVNRQVGEDARALGVPVSVADRRDECTFWFPAVVRSGDLVAGLVSAGGDHALVKRAAQMLRDGEVLKDAQNSDWQP